MDDQDADVDGSSTDSVDDYFREPPVASTRLPKDPRTKAKYNLFSRLLFLWLEPLFWTGCRRRLSLDDLYAHPSEFNSRKLLNRFNRYWLLEVERKRRGQSARLWLALLRCTWWRFVVSGVMAGIEVAVLLGQSVVLGSLSDYFTIEDPTGEETRDAYLYAAGLFSLGIAIAMLHAHGFLSIHKIGVMARIITTSAIYQKVLTLSQVTIGKVSVGHVINLATNDVQMFELAFFFVHFVWIAPLHLIVFTYLVYQEVGWSAFLAAGFIVLQPPLQILFAKVFSYFRFKSAKVTDNRIRVMNEVITGIRVIKMYAWEYAFKRVVSTLRRLESTLILKGGSLHSLTTAFNFGVAVPLTAAITFLSFTATGGELSPRKVFVTLSLLDPLGRSFTNLAESFFFMSEARVSFVRLQKFLHLEEIESACTVDHNGFHAKNSEQSTVVSRNGDISRHPYFYNSLHSKLEQKVSNEGYFRPDSPCLSGFTRNRENSPPTVLLNGSSPSVVTSASMDSVSASWAYAMDKLVLSNISFEVNRESHLMAVVGPVGAGKSTLLQLVLQELKPMGGRVNVNGVVSYASQQPWVFTGTLRENILFGLPFKSRWYDRVLEACSLDKDITMLINGDLTLVGERGVTLSGGQKARVNLARAIYRDADIYLLDDPLSAVDAAVAKQLFEECIRGLLRDKLVILVTHQVQFALQADKLLALKDGEVHIYGTTAELEERGVDTTQLLGLIKTEEEVDKEFEYEGDSDSEEEQEGDPSSPGSNLLEVTANNRWKRQTSFPEEVLDTDVASIYSAPSMLSIHSALGTSKHEDQDVGQAPPEEEKAHGSISMKTYLRFFTAGGGYLLLMLTVAFFFLAEANVVVSDWWISDWADCSSSNQSMRSTCELNTRQRISIYSPSVVTVILLNFTRAILLYFLCVNASRVLHNRMFAAVLRAPVLFFDTNPSGRVLNRFSKDTGFIDILLPRFLLICLMLLMRFIAAIVTASAANVYILIPSVVIIVVFLTLRWYYLKAAREVKRLEAISRSPLYSHISMTLQGLPTIRSCGKQHMDTALEKLHLFQNVHSQGLYLYLAATRWFGMRIDMLAAVFVAIVAFASVPLTSELNAGLVGLSLTYSISLTGAIQYSMRLSAEVENLMVSTERIMAYGRLEPEAPLETLPPNEKPPSNWPDKGKITFEDVAFQYSSDLPLVLKNLCVTVQPSEKVGIVGRTGAGKSSLISVLYRLAEPFGLITIDDVDTKSIGLHDLRKKMSIIPQDPVLFSGTMRYNLDPFDEYSDAELWEALEQVQLKAAVQQLEGQLGSEVSEGGSNFSVGQRQLVCLARALLRKNKILVLDEATANVDQRTDEIIQMAIRDKFSKCTVLTIAHRLNTIMDSDRILVMSRGQVKEFDTPYRLLQNSKSQLYKTVEKTGPTASRKLHQMAVDARLLRRRRSSARVSDVPSSNSHPLAVVKQL